MFANPMYDDQLPTLLERAEELMADASDSKVAARLFALVPFDIGRTMCSGLGRSGGKVLVTFAPEEYDFVFFSHWFGGSAGDAKTLCGAPFRLALLMWESPVARAKAPLSPAALDALRDWAALSSLWETPEVELRRPMRKLTDDHGNFEHTKAYFAPALMQAGLAPLHSMNRADAHQAAAARLSGHHASTVVRTAVLAGLASTAANDLHQWLATRWLTFATDLWQQWGKAQPPRPPKS